MASSSTLIEDDRDPSFDDEDDVDEIEGFDDYTLASKWERFISEIEAVCRLWLADGPNNLLAKNAEGLGFRVELYKVKFDVKYGMKPYRMEYFFRINNNGKTGEWKEDLHNLQLSFGVKEFLVIAPLSASGVVLDAPEATKLLSSVAIALSNCGSIWPAFVPVHDPTRKAFIGIQNMGMSFTRRFEADRIGSQVPIRLMHLEGLYELFISKFAFSTTELSTNFVKVSFTMKLTYRTPPHDDDDEMQGGESETAESGVNSDGDTRSKTQWDDDCPWTEWYSAEDPVKGFELITIWGSKMVESSLEMAEFENASSQEADMWFLLPMVPGNLMDSSKINTVGFASQLRLLVNALSVSFEAKFMEDFVSVENPSSDSLKPSTTIPPPTVLDRVLKDLFHEGLPSSNFGDRENKNARAIKGAPLQSLFSQFCLHSLWFGNCNIRAIAVLWIEFVREVRWYWEESEPLPRMPTNAVIDLSTCLIHQKLQMLALCIERKGPLDHGLNDGDGSKDSPHVETNREVRDEGSLKCQRLRRTVDENVKDELQKSSVGLNNPHGSESSGAKYSIGPQTRAASADVDSVDQARRGSVGVAGNMMLLNSHQKMHAPFTQDAPIMTEDMHEERLHAIEAFGNASSKSFSAQLEKDILASDMSAFKAANPSAVFEDFIRWHSPGDWETESSLGSSKMEGLRNDWPPKGRLSQRMSEGGNSWRQIWNEVPALPASEQKPLLEPNQEGEKILHYLETLPPHQLLEQMVCTAFRASADTLNQTSFGGLKQMITKVEQLYLTIASTLKPLKAKHLSEKEEFIGDVHRLCDVFEQIEKLLIFAASIHRKLLHAPRLCEAIFTDYFNYFIPRLASSSLGISSEKDFNDRQLVRMYERDTVANIFTPPTANQSWRKVLSMGNLLNGHEPILREIIFSARDSIGDHYGHRYGEEIETYRMYICGTSNDLHVALSVTSCD